MNKQELYDYVMRSPHNTNPAILKQAIDEVSKNTIGNLGIYVPEIIGKKCMKLKV